jgi:SAM-dependent methyltransferase
MKQIRVSRPCPICQSESGDQLAMLEYATLDSNPLASAFSIVSCSNCSFVYFDTPSSEQDFASFYKDHYYVNTAGRDNSLVAPNNVLKVIGDSVSKDAAICELGCGRGQHLLDLRQHGYTNLYGIEPSSECVNYLKSEHGIEVACAAGASMPFDRKFDVIISEHTLEHVLDLNAFVSTIYNSLDKSGCAYIEVPDLSAYGNHWPRDLITVFEHINHFTVSSLSALFARHKMGLKSFGRYVIDNVWRGSMPALYAVFQKDLLVPVAHENLEASEVSKWLSSGSFMNEEKIHLLVRQNIPVYIWGINYTVQKFLLMSALKDCQIFGLVDRDKNRQGRKAGKYTIQSPEIIKNAPAHSAIIVCEGVYRKDIEKNIRDMGYGGEVVVI